MLGDPTSSSSGGVSYEPGDAGTNLRVVHGSPLCGVTPDDAAVSTCTPDESDAMKLALQCPPDMGSGNDSGASSTTLACRVEKTNGSPHPVCTQAATGIDGARCAASTDCGAGFECIERSTTGGDGVCRKYCCVDDCATSTFCDFGVKRSTTTAVPVCVPVRSCELLATRDCAANETCSIVRDDGSTSCVLKGGAALGASCEVDRCGANQACLGSMGMRKCVQLCRIGGNDCGLSTCRSTSLVQDPRIGICQ